MLLLTTSVHRNGPVLLGTVGATGGAAEAGPLNALFLITGGELARGAGGPLEIIRVGGGPAGGRGVRAGAAGVSTRVA